MSAEISFMGVPPAANVPGYTGHVPAMRNHVHGQTYANATIHAALAADVQKAGNNPSGMHELVDKRPQGRDFLYAQTVTKGTMMDSLGKVSTGEPLTYTLPCKDSVSLPELSFQHRAIGLGKRVPAEKIPPEVIAGKGRVPGFTGHLHAGAHMFGTPYGRASKELEGGFADTLGTSNKLMRWHEDRPQGQLLQGEGLRIPGYTGHIPSKDPHIYGKTYGTSTVLALRARDAQQLGEPATALPELVDSRPQGNIDLFSQNLPPEIARTSLTLPRKKVLGIGHDDGPRGERGMGVAVVNERDTDHGSTFRRKTHLDFPEIGEVNKGRHCLPGYTGHVPGEQHVYGTTYGLMTGNILKRGHLPKQPRSLVKFEDFRPQRTANWRESEKLW